MFMNRFLKLKNSKLKCVQDIYNEMVSSVFTVLPEANVDCIGVNDKRVVITGCVFTQEKDRYVAGIIDMGRLVSKNYLYSE